MSSAAAPRDTPGAPPHLAARVQAVAAARARKDAARAALQAARAAGLAARHRQKLARQKPADDLALPDEVPW